MSDIILKRATFKNIVAVSVRTLMALTLTLMMLMGSGIGRLAYGADEPEAEEATAAEEESDDASVDTAGPDMRPSVLLVDASLGDLNDFKEHWLGEKAEIVAQEGDMVLMSTVSALWWLATSDTPESAENPSAAISDVAPPTYLLGNTENAPLTSDSIAWALDRIHELAVQFDQESKTVIVAAGATGLQARIYAEDLGQVRQSDRADLVGMVFLGTPHAGYSIAAEYPDLEIWDKLATAAGFEASDLAPGSDFLTTLNSTPVPNVVQLLQIQGQASNFGYGITDAATVAADMEWQQANGQQISSKIVPVTISEAIGLAPLWGLATHEDIYGARALDADAVLRLPTLESYFTSSDVMVEVRNFYQSWFPEKAPVTHVSSVLLLDISGSMVESLDSGGIKQEAEIDATTMYLQAVGFRSTQSFAAPEDVTVIVFNESAATVATGYDDAALQNVAQISAQPYNTDIGLALQTGLDSINAQPRCAEKHILLLSDGVSTTGMSNSEILSGPVSVAKSKSVVVNAVALGDMDQSDAGFLGEIATSTGGVLYQNRDIYGLLVSFLSSRYSALGLDMVDVEVQAGETSVTELGTMAEGMRSLEIGVLAEGQLPAWRLLLDGKELEIEEYSTHDGANDLLSIEIESPAPGSYSLELSDVSNRAHVFAVGQLGVAERAVSSAQTTDNSLLILIGAGIVMLLAILIVVINGVVKSKRSKKQGTSEEAGLIVGAQQVNEKE